MDDPLRVTFRQNSVDTYVQSEGGFTISFKIHADSSNSSSKGVFLFHFQSAVVRPLHS